MAQKGRKETSPKGQKGNKMEDCKVCNLYNLEETIAKDLLEKVEYPWEALAKINDYILELGNKLDPEKYDKVGEDVWIAKSATVMPTAYIHGPAIIGENAEVRHCAFIRGKAIVGEGAVVGNSTELKNVILFTYSSNVILFPGFHSTTSLSQLFYPCFLGG